MLEDNDLHSNGSSDFEGHFGVDGEGGDTEVGDDDEEEEVDKEESYDDEDEDEKENSNSDTD